MKEDAKKLKLFIYDRRMPVEKDVIWETKQKIIDDFKYDGTVNELFKMFGKCLF